MIQFESVSKTFRDGTTAVTDLNLTVPSGKITVIVGPSGCGKTTTLRMVNRMLEPSKGRITWDGTPLKSKRKTTLRRQMGYVIQGGGLFPHRTVLENIGTVPALLHWKKEKIRKRSFELLASVGLESKLANRYPAQLSGGQQQRVGVARALAADPLVLLMDEPFSAVDPVVRNELQDFFLRLQSKLSKTIIFITHDIDEAIKLGDQVAILRLGGRLAQVGIPQQLLEEPADAFVEGFIGKDRGYRFLSFLPSAELALGSVQVVRDPAAATEPNALIVDAEARPLGWVDPSRPNGVHPLGSTFDPETDSLRVALDAALTSPSGLAVAVNRASGGRYAGVVMAQEILSQVRESRSENQESIAVFDAVDEAAPQAAGDADQSLDEPADAERADGDVVDTSEELAAVERADGDADETSEESAAVEQLVDESPSPEHGAPKPAGSDRATDEATNVDQDPDDAANVDQDAGDAANVDQDAEDALREHGPSTDTPIVVAGVPVNPVPRAPATNGHLPARDGVSEWEPDERDATEVELAEVAEDERSEAPVR